MLHETAKPLHPAKVHSFLSRRFVKQQLKLIVFFLSCSEFSCAAFLFKVSQFVSGKYSPALISLLPKLASLVALNSLYRRSLSLSLSCLPLSVSLISSLIALPRLRPRTFITMPWFSDDEETEDNASQNATVTVVKVTEQEVQM